MVQFNMYGPQAQMEKITQTYGQTQVIHPARVLCNLQGGKITFSFTAFQGLIFTTPFCSQGSALFELQIYTSLKQKPKQE